MSVALHNSNRFDRPAKTLTDVFGADFRITDHDPTRSAKCGAANCSPSCGCADGICITSGENGTWEVTLLGLPGSPNRFDASAALNSIDRQSIVRLARVARNLMEKDETIDGLNDELGYFIEQVSGDLEEACWFRKMAEQVAACRADEPMEILCDRILPQLRNLLYAKAAVVFSDVEFSDNGPTLRTLGLNAEDGSQDWAEVGKGLVGQFGEDGANQSVVQNAGFPLGTLECPTVPIGSFVLVRIGTQTKHFGWLVAIGRTDAVGPLGQSRRSESEFGTHEATLMETAAVLLATHAANCELFDEQEKTLIGVVTAMVNALDARDPYTRGHSHRVALIGQRLAKEIGMNDEECEDIYLTGLLHDIGKIGVADHVLLKNGPLDPEERKQIEQHTEIGHSILKPVRQLNKVLPGVLHHHEKMDGSGYPEKLAGHDIPIAGRILAVADAFDAMTTSRPYRNAMPVVQAVQILLEGIGTHWDELVVDAFFRSMGDIREIYERETDPGYVQPSSLLQYGRFEDASHSRLGELAKLSMPGE